MTKFNKDLKIEVIMDIESGNSISGAAKKFGISRSMARLWFRQYTSGGIEQALSSKKTYTQEFKLHAVEYRRAFGLSYPQAVADLGISNPGTLFTWDKRYLELGLDGLQDTRKGRPPSMTKKVSKAKKPMTREQELEAEINRLRMENDYLKKLNALVKEREISKKRTK